MSILDLNNKSSNNMPKIKLTLSKKLIPWRDKLIGPVLICCLFRLAVVEQIHLKKTGIKQEERWEKFTSTLFNQPEFDGYEGSCKSVKHQFMTVRDERAKFHGWLDENGGVTGNLSNHEGELDELDTNIKQILQDLEELKAQKELKDDLAKNMDKNENIIIH